jgi:hypothetical protein
MLLAETFRFGYRRIQNAWRRFVNMRIYAYYKDLINFQMSCDPALLLRHISPAEAELAKQDAAIGVHVRFRLGGSTFPPTIFFKVTRPMTCQHVKRNVEEKPKQRCRLSRFSHTAPFAT